MSALMALYALGFAPPAMAEPRPPETSASEPGFVEDPLDEVGLGNIGIDWVVTGTDRATLVVSTPDRDVVVTVEGRLTLGPVDVVWSQAPIALPANTSTDLPLELPANAQLGPEAADYVEYLFVVARVTEADGREGQEEDVRGFVAWPDGLSAAPVVWSLEEGRSRAPGGVVDPQIATNSAKYGANVRFLPPMAAPTVRAPEADDEGGHHTSPVADTLDEGGAK